MNNLVDDFFLRGSPNILVMSAASQDVMDYLSQDGHQITLLAAHDNMMTAFLVALKVFKDWGFHSHGVTP